MRNPGAQGSAVPTSMKRGFTDSDPPVTSQGTAAGTAHIPAGKGPCKTGNRGQRDGGRGNAMLMAFGKSHNGTGSKRAREEMTATGTRIPSHRNGWMQHVWVLCSVRRAGTHNRRRRRRKRQISVTVTTAPGCETGTCQGWIVAATRNITRKTLLMGELSGVGRGDLGNDSRSGTTFREDTLFVDSGATGTVCPTAFSPAHAATETKEPRAVSF